MRIVSRVVNSLCAITPDATHFQHHTNLNLRGTAQIGYYRLQLSKPNQMHTSGYAKPSANHESDPSSNHELKWTKQGRREARSTAYLAEAPGARPGEGAGGGGRGGRGEEQRRVCPRRHPGWSGEERDGTAAASLSGRQWWELGFRPLFGLRRFSPRMRTGETD
jgi:hypothetical protein